MATSLLPPKHKRGVPFKRLLPIPLEGAAPIGFPDGYFVGWVPTSQIRDENGVLMSDVSCTWIDPLTTRNLFLRVADTTSWEPGQASIDVLFTRVSDGDVIETTTATFTVVQWVTRPS